MTNLALIGGAAMYHGHSFAGLLNGLAASQTLPTDWPEYPRTITDARITVVWDEDRAAARQLARVFGIGHVAVSLEDVLQYCDGVIITDDGTQNHCRHAPFFLERGIPTFIDKPLAPDYAIAQSLVDLAAKYNAPVMTGSALRYATETAELRANPDEFGRVELATAVGPNELFYYGIHPLELAMSVMGGGITTVQNIGTPDHDIVKLTYGDCRVLMLLVSRKIGFRFELKLYGQGTHREILVTDASGFYTNQLNLVVQMVRDHKAPVDVKDGLEAIRILEAAKQSLAEGGSVVGLN